ncbi:glycosyltransferase family 2 protein [Synechococcus sp. UW105]|uniref:glycosyltransferase family 2 protein n=1 Tax=Synechococcus sp. UW105 TaxID=337067 RepID=UPI000E0E6D59|nr:glycosyltransferase family 2 protein [Synechococcus sp. UW105]
MTSHPNFTPKISIISPIYNVNSFLVSTHESIKAQTFFDWEWIIVNDGSTDSSAEICNTLASTDPRIRLFHLPRNMGRGFARNFALFHVKSPFTTIWDVDDTYPSTRLANIFNLLNSGCDYCWEPVYIVNSKNAILRKLPYAGLSYFPLPFHNTLSYKTSLGLSYLYQMLGTYGGIGEDYYLVYALAVKHTGKSIPSYSRYFLSREQSNLKTFHSHLGRILALIRIFFNQDLPFTRRLCLFSIYSPKAIVGLAFSSIRFIFNR